MNYEELRTKKLTGLAMVGVSVLVSLLSDD